MILRNTLLFLVFTVCVCLTPHAQNCSVENGSIYGSPDLNERGKSLAPTAENDGFYVAGYMEDDVLIMRIALNGEVEWSRTFEVIPGQRHDVNAMILDSDNMLVVAGTTGGQIPGDVMFIFRYDPVGDQVLWSRELSSATHNEVMSLIQKEPDFYILSTNPSAGNEDAELLEISKEGIIFPGFAKDYHLGSSDFLAEITMHEGFVYGVGRYTDGQGVARMRHALAKVNADDGSQVWVKLGHIPQEETARFYGIDIVIFQDEIYSMYQGDPDGTSLINVSLYLQKTSLDGDLIWLKQYELPGFSDYAYELMATSDGLIALASEAGSQGKIVLFKVDTEGEVLWANRMVPASLITSAELDRSINQILQINDQLIIVGTGVTNNGTTDILVIRANLNGQVENSCMTSESFSLLSEDVENPVFYDVTPEEFPAEPELLELSLSSTLSLVELRQECAAQDTLITNVTATICEGLSFEGYTESGIYQDTFLTAEGCDSIRILDLTVIETVNVFINASICAGESFEGYTETGIYQDTFVTAEGCDSIRILDLTVDSFIINEVFASICSGESFEGYTESGVFQDTFPTGSGCDSIRILHLTVMLTDTVEISQTICLGQSFEGYTESGLFIDTLTSSVGCDSIRILDLTVLQPVVVTIVRDICTGGSFEGHTEPGIFQDTLTAASGCDSIRIIDLTVIDCQPIVHYGLEACQAYMHNGTNMDYSEFVPAYPNVLTCSGVSAGTVHRINPQENKHSCTPGVNATVAMCVSSYNSCTYSAGHQASVIIEVTMNPQTDSIVRLTGLEFYEKAPSSYVWIDGPSGPNNYPRRYGIRILKNGTEIFRMEDIATTLDWTLESFDFTDNDQFRVSQNSVFRIELLPYCPVGNGAEVSAWDLDEIRVFGACIPVSEANPGIAGNVSTKNNEGIPGVEIYLSESQYFLDPKLEVTDEFGKYEFDELQKGQSYFLRGVKNDDSRNGVSTLDLLHIQKHLLGIAPFTSLDQYIAADANRSGAISSMDILEIRKLILGIYNEFPRNTSWRFGELPLDLDDIEMARFVETPIIESLGSESNDLNFIGIKIGDVNGDVQVHAHSPEIKYRSSYKMSMNIRDVRFQNGKSFALEVIAGNQIPIAGIQFALDLNGLELVSVGKGVLPVGRDNYHVGNDGIMTFSLSASEGIHIQEGDRLFVLHLNPVKDGQIGNTLQLVNAKLLSQAYLSNTFEVVDLDIQAVSSPGVSGNVVTKFGTGIAGVEIQLSEDQTFLNPATDVTDNQGRYGFDGLVEGKSYYLRGVKNDDPKNGVSTLDLIHLQRHLLGLVPFTSVDQIIAADVNRSSNISAIDLIEIRKLILGVYHKFPHGISWRFGALPLDLNNIVNPVFDEIALVGNLGSEGEEQNFLGIKIGDINGDARTQAQSFEIETRSDHRMILHVPNERFQKGKSFAVEATAGNNIDISGIQFALNLGDLELISVDHGALPVTMENYHLEDDGIMTFSFSSTGDLNIHEGDRLFVLHLNPGKDGQTRDVIRLVHSRLSPQAYLSHTLEIADLDLQFGGGYANKQEGIWLTAAPNPFYDELHVHFQIEKEGMVEIRFVDAAGKVLYSTSKLYLAGEHYEKINAQLIPALDGMLHCQLVHDQGTVTTSLVRKGK